jgi:Flp pilus assembly protein TadB
MELTWRHKNNYLPGSFFISPIDDKKNSSSRLEIIKCHIVVVLAAVVVVVAVVAVVVGVVVVLVVIVMVIVSERLILC